MKLAIRFGKEVNRHVKIINVDAKREKKLNSWRNWQKSMLYLAEVKRELTEEINSLYTDELWSFKRAAKL